MNKKENGAALVELALILPLLLLLTMITTEFGRAMYQYNTITKSVRDAVRFLSVQTPNTHVVEAQNLVVFGSTIDTGNPLAIGLAVDQVGATWQLQNTAPIIRTVTVSVTNYTFVPLFGNVFGVAFGNANGGIPFGAISATMRAPL